jgi:hypothetical protein
MITSTSKVAFARGYKNPPSGLNARNLLTKFILFFFLIVSFVSGISQTTNLSFTKIPFSDPDIIKPGAGPEYWIYQSTVRYPNANSPEDNSLDRYDRFEWRSFENGTQGVYNWTEFDNSINTAISKRQKFSFGIMTYCESCSDFRTSVGGADLTSYPPYLHNLMQAEATNSRDWVANGTWIPNYNSPNYLDRHKALLNALAAHIASTSYNGVPYSRVIRYIDVRGIGNYNEWHHYGYLDQIPTGRFPTVATYKRIVDDYISAFPNYQLVALSDGFDPSGSSNTPPEVISYLLTARNNVGKLGYRRDNIGSGFLWVNSKLENNPAVWNGVRLKDSIMTRWQTAPLVGEAMNCCSADGGNQIYFDLSRQISFYHINSMGNGNFENGTSATTQNAFRAAGKLMGFRYVAESGSMATTITRGVPFNITLGWKNEGNSPTYERWFIDFTLRNTTTNAIVWTGTSKYNLKALLPLTTATNISESFTVPTSVAAGTYRLHMTVRDSSGYRNPMPLFITGVQSDGSYILRSSVTVSASGNASPVANAGVNQSITLPASSVTLSGSGTDADGTISSYSWAKVSGTGGTIVSPGSASTSVTGLTAGTYVFRLTVTDNLGATANDDVQITVINPAPPPPPNSPPFANAGSDQTVTLPANTASLNGSATDPDGSIATYAWTKVSGPAGGTLQTPNAAGTNVTALIAGTYVFRLTVTDNDGAIHTDDVQVIVNPAIVTVPPNQAPVANAGTDKAITLPVNTVTLNGSGTDADGTITTYTWTKVSGPAGGNIQTPAANNTNVTGLNAGTYVFRLTVTDNDGATGTDNVTVVVSASLAPSPSNQAPVANAGNNIIITLPVNTASLAGSGTDADGSIATYSWTKVSGPTGGNIQSANTASTNITSLIAGTYVYRLTVTDNVGAQSTDDVQITVNPAPAPVGNQAPIANAGTNRSITLPTNSVSFTGSGTDPDGTIASYSWSKVSGPAGGTIQTANAATTNITGLIAGTYVFRLTVTDNDGASASDDIQLTVNAAPVLPNQAPIANAGRDISITLPVNSTVLNGSASTDPDGSIVSYAWRKVQGPNGSSLTANNSASATASDLTRGVHEYELTVTDNRGGTATDRVLVTVIRINQRPVAQTTRDTINLALPVQNTELNAASSYDPDGTISNYQWTYTRGPKEPKVLTPTASKTIVADLVAGTYSFDLVVTDNDGDKTSKSVVVIVSNSSSRRQIPDVSIYPNPATGLVNVKINTPVEGRTTLTFVDMNGRPVMTDSFIKGFSSFTRQVNISSLPKGTYAIIIQVDQTEKVVEKVIKF